MQMVTCFTYSLIFFMGVLCHLCHCILLNVSWHLIAHQRLTLAHFSLYWYFQFHILDCPFIVFHLFSLIYTYFFIVYSPFLKTIYSLYFQPHFWGAFPRDGFTYFMHAIVYFLSIAKHIVTQISPQLSVLFLYKFFTSIFHCQCLVTCDTHTPFFKGVLVAVIS